MFQDRPSRLRSTVVEKRPRPPVQIIGLYYKKIIFEGHSFFVWFETCNRFVCMLKVGIFLSIAVCGRHLLSEAQMDKQDSWKK